MASRSRQRDVVDVDVHCCCFLEGDAGCDTVLHVRLAEMQPEMRTHLLLTFSLLV